MLAARGCCPFRFFSPGLLLFSPLSFFFSPFSCVPPSLSPSLFPPPGLLLPSRGLLPHIFLSFSSLLFLPGAPFLHLYFSGMPFLSPLLPPSFLAPPPPPLPPPPPPPPPAPRHARRYRARQKPSGQSILSTACVGAGPTASCSVGGRCAVTLRTRPPLATMSSPFFAVPAWKTVTPGTLPASSRLRMTPPFFGSPDSRRRP